MCLGSRRTDPPVDGHQRCIHYLDRPFHRLGQVVMHSLDLRVRLQTVRPQLPPDTTLLEAPKRHAGVQEGVLVNPDCPCVQLGSETRGLTTVVREHCGCEAVRRVVGELDRFFFRLEF